MSLPKHQNPINLCLNHSIPVENMELNFAGPVNLQTGLKKALKTFNKVVHTTPML